MWCSNCMSSCCPCLEDDIEEEEKDDSWDEPKQEQPLSPEQEDDIADKYFERNLNKDL